MAHVTVTIVPLHFRKVYVCRPTPSPIFLYAALYLTVQFDFRMPSLSGIYLEGGEHRDFEFSLP